MVKLLQQDMNDTSLKGKVNEVNVVIVYDVVNVGAVFLNVVFGATGKILVQTIELNRCNTYGVYDPK